MSALRCALCARASGDHPSLYGDLKPGIWFLFDCASWTASKLSFDSWWMISAGSMFSRFEDEDFSDMMSWYRWTSALSFGVSSVRSS